MRRLALISLAILALAIGACGSASPTTNSAAGAKAAATQFINDLHHGKVVRSETTSSGWEFLQTTGGSLPFNPTSPAATPGVQRGWAYFPWGANGQASHWMRFVYQNGRWLFNDAL